MTEANFGRKPRYSMRDAAALLGVSRVYLYRRMRAGSLRTVLDGRRRFVLHDDLVAAAKGNLQP